VSRILLGLRTRKRSVIFYSSPCTWLKMSSSTQNIVASVGAKKLSLSLLPGVIIIVEPAGVECQRKDTGRATQQPLRPLPQHSTPRVLSFLPFPVSRTPVCENYQPASPRGVFNLLSRAICVVYFCNVHANTADRIERAKKHDSPEANKR